jgi:5-formyltetrahydrofolate cyclo-ligase
MPQSAAIDTIKAAVRREAIARRDAIPAEERAAAAQTIAARAFPIPVPPGIIVSGFIPLNNEIDVRPLLRKLSQTGAKLALPVVVARGEPLIMRDWEFGAPLKAGGWGISEPLPHAPEVLPDILLVPLLAFDRAGNRIGYGAGYFDITISSLRAQKPVTAIGVAFAPQEIAQVPTTPRDAPLDLVLTEREVINARPA